MSNSKIKQDLLYDISIQTNKLVLLHMALFAWKKVNICWTKFAILSAENLVSPEICTNKKFISEAFKWNTLTVKENFTLSI